MEQEGTQVLLHKNFPLFCKRPNNLKPHQPPQNPNQNSQFPELEKETSSSSPDSTNIATLFSDLGLVGWAIQTCHELGMKNPTPVQSHCIPQILIGRDILGLAQTESGKTTAFALPILHRLAEDPYGLFALVVTPTREFAYQLSEQFRALGSYLHLRCTVVVGSMDLLTQAKTLMGRPHVVIATPGRLKVLLEENADIPLVFSRTKDVEDLMKGLSPTIFEDFMKPFQINMNEEGPLSHKDKLRYQPLDVYPAPLHR